MNGHVWEKHERCERDHCPICEGGLSSCVVCRGAEASLPSECPKRKMTMAEQDAVQAGDLDFVAGQWRVTRHDNIHAAILSPYGQGGDDNY